MSFFIVQSPYPCRAQRLAYLLFDAVFGFPAYYYEPESDVGVRTLKRRESFVFESLFLNWVTGRYPWNK